jgi:hypothetical protein
MRLLADDSLHDATVGTKSAPNVIPEPQKGVLPVFQSPVKPAGWVWAEEFAITHLQVRGCEVECHAISLVRIDLPESIHRG